MRTLTWPYCYRAHAPILGVCCSRATIRIQAIIEEIMLLCDRLLLWLHSAMWFWSNGHNQCVQNKHKHTRMGGCRIWRFVIDQCVLRPHFKQETANERLGATTSQPCTGLVWHHCFVWSMCVMKCDDSRVGLRWGRIPPHEDLRLMNCKVEYAALDAHVLITIYDILSAQLEALGQNCTELVSVLCQSISV